MGHNNLRGKNNNNGFIFKLSRCRFFRTLKVRGIVSVCGFLLQTSIPFSEFRI
jgi:hypothetical protein